jgi:hypothetical protein
MKDILKTRKKEPGQGWWLGLRAKGLQRRSVGLSHLQTVAWVPVFALPVTSTAALGKLCNSGDSHALPGAGSRAKALEPDIRGDASLCRP